MTIYWGEQATKRLTLPRAEVEIPVDVAWDARTNEILVCHVQAYRSTVTRWTAQGKRTGRWAIPEDLLPFGALHWQGSRLCILALIPPLKQGRFAIPKRVYLSQADTRVVVESAVVEDYTRSLDPARDRTVRQALESLGWKLYTGVGFGTGHHYPEEGWPLSERSINAHNLITPMAWTDDTSLITAGSMEDERVYLAVRKAGVYTTQDIGPLLRQAVQARTKPTTGIKLINAAVAPGQAFYGFQCEGPPRAWYVVRVKQQGEGWRVIRVVSGLLARPVEVFREPKLPVDTERQ